MSDRDPLNEISDSLREIANAIKPKPKKPNYTVMIGWIVIGAMALYMINVLYKMFLRF
ncbi:hypothetical protein ACUH7Y_09755 [Clostridium beijerinckii]|uniref:Uncharacterized protein n=1 Tax=Clostridium beijerinckii TaxID=1520 RepID=A0A7X9SMG7_CLOBE|nr:hypothetical protein [Clostridium beijerinckii]NMF04596.1 hypothetical protein [Clostridium beijerinckii]